MTLTLYPKRPVETESFKGVKLVTIPNQSMTLHEIIKRFTRKESLPIEKEGVYADNLGDLEKMQREDITIRHERAAEIGRATKAWQKREEAKKAPEGASGEPLKGATPPVQTPPTPPPPGPTPVITPDQTGRGT